jgi:hypothetical protein
MDKRLSELFRSWRAFSGDHRNKDAGFINKPVVDQSA